MYTIIVTGSRDFHRSWMISDTLSAISRAHDYDIFIRVGDCPTGVDKYTLSWCETALENDQFKVYEAEWKKYKWRAGPIRNHRMVDDGADLCIAWPLEESRGTKDCAEYAASKGIEVWFPELPAWAQWAAPIAQYREE